MSVATVNSPHMSVETFVLACGTVRQCRVWLTPEEDGGFSIEAVSLPGVASQGETIDEALENIKDAFSAAISTYKEMNVEIPWTREEPKDCPVNMIERRILLDA